MNIEDLEFVLFSLFQLSVGLILRVASGDGVSWEWRTICRRCIGWGRWSTLRSTYHLLPYLSLWLECKNRVKLSFQLLQVRSKLFGHKEPKYSNFICYTGVAEFNPQYLPYFGYKIFIGKNQYFVALDIGKGRMQWYAFVREPRNRPVSSKGVYLSAIMILFLRAISISWYLVLANNICSGNKHMILEFFGRWCDEVVTIIRRTEEEMIIRRPIHDIDMTSTWGKDRVILLGDAAHAMLPNLGQGGSMAIEVRS